MSDAADKPQLSLKGLALKALGAIGGAVGLVAIGLAYARVGGT